MIKKPGRPTPPRDAYQKKVDALLLEKVKPWAEKLPWYPRTPVLYDGSEGYKGQGILGCRAGPVDGIGFDNLAHEMGHAIEIVQSKGPEGLRKDGWGLSIRSKVQIGSEVFHEPRTLEATRRECRAVGIQIHLLEMVGHPEAKKALSYYPKVLVSFMPDWWLGGDDEKQRVAYRRRLIEEAYQDWTPERVTAAWEAIAPILQARAIRNSRRQEGSPTWAPAVKPTQRSMKT